MLRHSPNHGTLRLPNDEMSLLWRIRQIKHHANRNNCVTKWNQLTVQGKQHLRQVAMETFRIRKTKPDKNKGLFSDNLLSEKH